MFIKVLRPIQNKWICCIPELSTDFLQRFVRSYHFQLLKNPIFLRSEILLNETSMEFCFLDILTKPKACITHSSTILTLTGSFLSYPNRNGQA